MFPCRNSFAITYFDNVCDPFFVVYLILKDVLLYNVDLISGNGNKPNTMGDQVNQLIQIVVALNVEHIGSCLTLHFVTYFEWNQLSNYKSGMPIIS